MKLTSRLARAAAVAGSIGAATLALLGVSQATVLTRAPSGGHAANALAAGAVQAPTVNDRFQPELGLPATGVVAIGASPSEKPGEVWAYGLIGDVPADVGGDSYSDQYTLLEHTDALGWQVVPLPADSKDEPLAPAQGETSPAEYGAFAGQATAAGGVVLLSGQNVLLRDPAGQPHLARAPSISEAKPLGSGESEPPAGSVMVTGESLLPMHPSRSVTLPYAAIDDTDANTGTVHAGILIAPSQDGDNPLGKPRIRPGVLHYDGERWTREPIELPPADAERFTVLALACGSAQSCWLLASSGSGSTTSLLLFQRAATSESPSGYTWKPVQVNAWPFGEQLLTGMTEAGAVAPLAQGAQMLTATDQGVWVDFQATIAPAGGNGRQTSDVSEFVRGSASAANVLGAWCYPTGAGCEQTLGAPLPSLYRSFAWPGAAEGLGTRIITGLPDHAMLEFSGAGFTYQIGDGGDTGEAPGGAAFGPPGTDFAQEGWIADSENFANLPDGEGQSQVVKLSAHPEEDQLGEESVPFRRPLYAVAQPPETVPGDPQAPAVAVGERGQVARYEAGRGWRPEALYDAAGKVQPSTLRGVAWPEPGRIYAVGDNGAMWLWRSETGLWEPDPAKPLNFIGSLQAIAFSPNDPNVGYAVGRQGALLKNGKSWEQVPLPAELQQANFTSITFAGGEALATYRIVKPDPEGRFQGSPAETGGIAVEEDGSGLHWHVDPGAKALLARLPAYDSVLSKVAGLPDGGVVAAGPGKVIERDSPGAEWRFSTQPLPEAQSISAVAAYRDPAGPVRAIVSIDLNERLRPERFLNNLEESPFKIDVPPPTGVGQPPVFLGPDLLPSSGYLLKETASGWSDMEHQALPATGGSLPLDMPIRPDPVLALLVPPSGEDGLAVGGQTGDLEGRGVGSFDSHYQTAAIQRFPANMASSNGTSQAPIATLPGQTSFVVAGQASCARECADFANEELGPDTWLTHALQEANTIAAGSSGTLHAFLYTGGRLPSKGSGDAFTRELNLYTALLGGGSLPVYAADSSDLGQFAPGGGGSPYYAFDSPGPGGTVRVIVLDYSTGELGAVQREWLQAQLIEAQARGEPAIVVGNDSLGFRLPDQSGSVGHELAEARDAGAVAAILVQDHASAYFFDYPGSNVKTTVGFGSSSIPAYGSGTLGYVYPPQENLQADSLGSSGFLLASVDVNARNPTTNVAPITVRVVPNISRLALDATDGVLLRRSQVGLFEALARRPPAGVALNSAAGGIELAGPDPYDPIPFDCQGSNCPYEVPTEYTFTSSNPDIGDFVAHEASSNNPRQVALGANELPVADPHSGLFCAYNEGTTTVSVTTGGLTYSEPVTVQGGSVEYPCGTVPLRRPPAPERVSGYLLASGLPAPLGASGPRPDFPHINVPPPPRAQPRPAPRRERRRPGVNLPFFVAPALLFPVLAIVPPPPAPTPRPTPPSGTAEVPAQSPVSQNVGVEEREEETQAVTQHVHNMAAYTHGDRPPLPSWPLALVPVLAVAGVALRPGVRARERAYVRSMARSSGARTP